MTLRFIKAYYTSAKTSMHFGIQTGVRHGCSALLYPEFWIKLCIITFLMTIKANVHVAGLVCADDFVILSRISIEISTGAINRHAAIHDIWIHASEAKVMLAHQFQAVLFDRDSLTYVNKCRFSGIRRSSQTTKAPRGCEAGLILPFRIFFACRPIFAHAV